MPVAWGKLWRRAIVFILFFCSFWEYLDYMDLWSNPSGNFFMFFHKLLPSWVDEVGSGGHKWNPNNILVGNILRAMVFKKKEQRKTNTMLQIICKTQWINISVLDNRNWTRLIFLEVSPLLLKPISCSRKLCLWKHK